MAWKGITLEKNAVLGSVNEPRPLIQELRGITPQIAPSTWIAPFAVVVGDVVIGDDCTIWYHSVLRGDVGQIKLGNRCNIQDGAMIHSTYDRSHVELGNDVSIGHRAIIHGCRIHDNVLVGMGAIVMDHAVIHSNSIIAAGAVVLENTVVPSGTIWAGVPAKQVKSVKEEVLGEKVGQTASAYVKYAKWYQE